MAQFNPAFERTVGLEGGYVNDPTDRGGETLCGISRVHFPRFEGWALVDAHLSGHGVPQRLPHLPILQNLIREFYQVEFWNRLKLDLIQQQEIAEEIFDSAVNCGVYRVAKWLQHACNLIGRSQALLEDGVVGKKTIMIVNHVIDQLGIDPLLTALKGLQFSHYHEIVLRDPSQLRFMRGWLRRV